MDPHYTQLRRAWHAAMNRGQYYAAWAILGELGEQSDFADWIDMRDRYHRGIA